MRKRTISFAIAMLMVLSIFSMPVHAEEPNTYASYIKVLLPLTSGYSSVVYFTEGLGYAYKDGKYIAMDRTGKIVLEYDGWMYFTNGLSVGYNVNSDQYGYIDIMGNTVIPFEYDYAKSFFGGYAAVQKNGKYGLINKNGNMVIPFEYDFLDYDFRADGLVDVGKEDKYGVVDINNNVIIPIEYDDMYSFSEGLANVEKDGKWFFIDKDNKTVAFPFQAIDYFDYGVTLVHYNDKYAYMDKSGAITVVLDYDNIERENDGSARVMKDSKFGYIDLYGNVIVPPEYENLDFRFSEGLIGATKDMGFYDFKHGFLGEDGKEAIPFEYDFTFSFSEGLAAVEKGGKWGYIDRNGKVAVPFEYDEVGYFSEGLAWVKKDSKWGILKNIAYNYPGEAAAPASVAPAKPISSIVVVDGKTFLFEAYNINGNNYFKLRDLAFAVNHTAKQFDVAWDDSDNAITLTSGKAYTPAGGEMTGKADDEKIAKLTTAKILLNGAEVNSTAYGIGGNNYFKLRDLGRAIDFNVSWDGENNTIILNTLERYTED